MTDTMAADLAVTYDTLLSNPSRNQAGEAYFNELIYAQPMGYRPLGLDLHLPALEGPHPVVVFIHGGAWMTGHPRVTNPVLDAMDIVGTLLKSGFAVARPAYRLSGEAVFPAQLHDCKAAIRYLRHHATALDINPDKIAAMGESAGGHLACMLGATSGRAEMEGDIGLLGPSSAVQAVIDWYGPTDLLSMDRQRPPNAVFSHDDASSPESLLIGGPVQQHKDLARTASPISFVRSGLPPFLIQHGDQDRLVPVGQARQLAEALRQHRVNVELSEIEGGDHCFWGVDTSAIMPEVIRFLQRHL